MSSGESRRTALWRDVFEAADRALELHGAERRAFIDQCLNDNPTVGGELKALIESGEHESVLEHSASAFSAPFLHEADAVGEPGIELPNGETAHFGAYRVRREIGSGGMGTVYLAERADDQFRKEVALKVLPRWRRGNREGHRRFLEERQILAKLDHPGIAHLLDGGVTADGTPWFAMEYIAGEPIDAYCETRQLTVDERLQLFCDVCDAVQYAHRNLVVHRDLKPSNILVASNGRVALLDFGIARLLAAEDALTAEATVTVDRQLTPLYSSPEQLRGEPVSTAADVYALGVLLHVLLTGTNPYGLTTLGSYEVAHAVLERDPERLSLSAARAGKPQLARRLRGDLEAIVLKAMGREAGTRYATVEQLETDVMRYLTGLPVLAQPESRSYVMRKFVRRHRTAVALAVVATMVLIAFAAVMTVQRSRIRDQAQRITRERDRAENIGQGFMTIFRNIAPGDSGITAREMLDSATSRINEELVGYPEQRSRLIFEMARAYHRIDLENRAASLLEASLALRRSLRPPPERDIAETLDLLGEVHLAQGMVAAADSDYSGALQLRRRNLPGQDPLIAHTLVGLASVRRAEGKLGDADRSAREAIEIDRAGGKSARAHLARSISSLAAVQFDRGEYAPAVELYRQSLELSRAIRPEEHPDVATAVLDLAAALNATGDSRAADSLIRYELALHRRVVMGAVLAGTQRTATTAEASDAPAAIAAMVDSTLSSSPSTARATSAPRASRRSLIAFVTDRDGPDAIGNLGNQEIYTMNPDGTDQRRLTHDKGADEGPTFSPDGKRIAFVSQRAGGYELFVMNADGSDQRQLTHFTELGRGALAPAWSPDGKRIAFSTRVPPIAIYVINVDGTDATKVSDDGGGASNPAWSPDGRMIAFNSRRTGKPQIYVMDADGKNLRRLTSNDAADRQPAWSPDGKSIAFESDRDGQARIYVMDPAGGNQRRVSSPPGADSHPSWSPDGRQIVFHKTVLGHGQVYVMDADGTHTKRLTALSTVAFSGFPTWGSIRQ
ncbi:MAG TPA: protein kinase [Gemmatimonadaceae bacterium]|jgi:serine/threonine-protein kinase